MKRKEVGRNVFESYSEANNLFETTETRLLLVVSPGKVFASTLNGRRKKRNGYFRKIHSVKKTKTNRFFLCFAFVGESTHVFHGSFRCLSSMTIYDGRRYRCECIDTKPMVLKAMGGKRVHFLNISEKNSKFNSKGRIV